ncbi:MAG: inositol monophosphatase family protein [Flavobacteriales bacterium]
MRNILKIYKTAILASIEAGIAIMEVFHSNDLGVEIKADNSPVTKADLISSELISNHLKTTNIPVIGEEAEAEDFKTRKKWKEVWIVDPLDGTKEFVKKTNEFTVNIGLVEDSSPVFGVIYVPPTNEVFFGGEEMGSFRFVFDSDKTLSEQIDNAIQLPTEPERTEKIIVTGGRNTTLSFFKESPRIQKINYSEFEFIQLSSSLKFCRIAEGKMDIYPRDYPCMEWDTAAGHAIVNGVGKDIYDIGTNKKLVYNKEDLYNPFFLLV